MTQEEITKLGEDLEKKFGGFSEKIDAKIKAAVDAAKTASADEMKTLKAELAGTYTEELKTKFKAQQDQIDAMDTKIQRVHVDPRVSRKQLDEFFADTLAGNDNFKAMVAKKARTTGEIQLKVDDMTTANTNSGVVIAPDHLTNIVYNPDASFRIRSLLAQGTTNSSSVTFVYESAISTNTDITAEAQEYMQEDVDLAVGTATVRKITNYIIASDELMEDVAGFSSYIAARLPSKLKVKEDTQLLRGSGAGINISGIVTNATAYSDNLADSNITRVDVLVDALRQVKDDEYMPNGILLHPADAVKLKLSKTSTGDYTMPWIYQSGQITLDGVPVYESTAMTAGTFLVGDFRLGAQVFDRKQMTLEISFENEANFVTGMVTIRVSERLALAVYRAKCFVYGGFAAALAQGSA
jgi:HK97 family phage major capsid protein